MEKNLVSEETMTQHEVILGSTRLGSTRQGMSNEVKLAIIDKVMAGEGFFYIDPHGDPGLLDFLEKLMKAGKAKKP